MKMLVFHGTLVHSTWNNPLEILTNTLIGVADRKIVFIAKENELENYKQKFQFSSDNVIKLNIGEFLIPGFVDTHVHAPQYLNVGKRLDVTLLDWLNNYTFPLESQFKDVEFATKVYEKAVSRLIRNGTTTACYFATIHLDSTLALCDIIGKLGQRAYVGKVCMCCNSPDYYFETDEETVQRSQTFVEQLLERKNDLVTPIITPRFTLSCTLDVMKQLGVIAKKYNVPIQSHLQETVSEEEAVRSIFSGYRSSTAIFEEAGLLTERTIMAHGVYLDDEDLKTVRSTKTSIAHCPNSNISLKSGLCDVRRLLENQVKVGLGTDLSGGYQSSMLDAIRSCLAVSIASSFRQPPNTTSASAPSSTSALAPTEYRPLDYKEAFRLATLGGSQAMGLSDKTGNFEVGKEFDAVRVNVMANDSAFDVTLTHDTIEDLVQKFVYLGDDRNIIEVYVAGRKVHCRAP